MKKLLAAISVIAAALLLASTLAHQVTAMPPPVTIELLNPPKHGLLELDVGESYTFDIEVTSDEPFVLALALTNEYYPGRGIFWNDSDRASQATSAVLQLTMKGKDSTADLLAVCDWPEPGYCWPEGVAPVAIAVGVRYAGGQVYSEQFPFAVVVPQGVD